MLFFDSHGNSSSPGARFIALRLNGDRRHGRRIVVDGVDFLSMW
jgi:hypothetical protein